MKKDERNILYNFKNEILKTTITGIDVILKGGLELGSTIQLVGEAKVGKTTIALQIAKSICSQDKKVIYIDTDNSVDISLITSIGLNDHLNKEFLFVKCFEFDEVQSALNRLINEQSKIGLIIIDSLGGLTSECFSDTNSKIKVTTNNSAYESIPLGRLVKTYSKICSDKNIALLLINQFRNKIVTQKNIGTITKRFGPKAIDYCSNVIIKINQSCSKGISKEFEEKFKNTKLIENKLAIIQELDVIASNKGLPNVKMPFVFEFGKGILESYSTAYALIVAKIISQNGTYYQCQQLGINANGIENLIKDLQPIMNNTQFNDKIYSYYYNKIYNSSAKS